MGQIKDTLLMLIVLILLVFIGFFGLKWWQTQRKIEKVIDNATDIVTDISSSTVESVGDAAHSIQDLAEDRFGFAGDRLKSIFKQESE